MNASNLGFLFVLGAARAGEGHTLTFDWWQNVSESPSESHSNQSLEKIERDHILAVMERCHWKINGDHGAAEVLAMHPNTLRSRMKRLGIVRPLGKVSAAETV